MNIRPAQPRDLELCLSLDPSYETNYVWQMESNRAPGAIGVGFRVTRLPRTMRVPGATARDVLLEHYEQGECFLVAEENNEIRGFLDATANVWKRIAWINYLTVAPERRRAGIGKALVRAMLDWAHTQSLDTVMVETQTKNYPASSLFQKQGFTFCGFNDHFYSNRDIAIFFALTLH
jgi:ribosomal protein S18 acetylase RimI-like enzyme